MGLRLLCTKTASPRRIRMMSVFSIGIFCLYFLLAFTWQLTALRLGFAFYTDINWRKSRRKNVLSFYTRCSIFFSWNLRDVVSLLAWLHFCPLDPCGCVKHESSGFSGCANANSNDWLSNSWQTKSIFHLPNKCGKKPITPLISLSSFSQWKRLLPDNVNGMWCVTGSIIWIKCIIYSIYSVGFVNWHLKWN